jgi:GNAT superfamily N-acetyltransferase
MQNSIESFYYLTATENERLELVEFAVISNEKFNARSVPLDYVREVLHITPEQIQAGYVIKLMQPECPYPLGFYALRTNPTDFANKRVELQLLYVHPDHVRGRLGEKLLKRAIDQAKKLGMQVMHGFSMPESLAFYEKYGAVQTGTHVNLFNPEGDAVLLLDLKI